MKKYSSIQRWDILPNKYRVKNYINKKWEYINTKKIKQVNTEHVNFYNYFCSQGCYNDFAHKYVREVIAIAPRTEALETPINVTKEPHTNPWNNRTYMETRITTVDNNGG
jgi:hypothetical protein